MFVLLRLFLVVAMLVSLSSVLSATYIYNKVVTIRAQDAGMMPPPGGMMPPPPSGGTFMPPPPTDSGMMQQPPPPPTDSGMMQQPPPPPTGTMQPPPPGDQQTTTGTQTTNTQTQTNTQNMQPCAAGQVPTMAAPCLVNSTTGTQTTNMQLPPPTSDMLDQNMQQLPPPTSDMLDQNMQQPQQWTDQMAQNALKAGMNPVDAQKQFEQGKKTGFGSQNQPSGWGQGKKTGFDQGMPPGLTNQNNQTRRPTFGSFESKMNRQQMGTEDQSGDQSGAPQQMQKQQGIDLGFGMRGAGPGGCQDPESCKKVCEKDKKACDSFFKQVGTNVDRNFEEKKMEFADEDEMEKMRAKFEKKQLENAKKQMGGFNKMIAFAEKKIAELKKKGADVTDAVEALASVKSAQDEVKNADSFEALQEAGMTLKESADVVNEGIRTAMENAMFAQNKARAQKELSKFLTNVKRQLAAIEKKKIEVPDGIRQAVTAIEEGLATVTDAEDVDALEEVRETVEEATEFAHEQLALLQQVLGFNTIAKKADKIIKGLETSLKSLKTRANRAKNVDVSEQVAAVEECVESAKKNLADAKADVRNGDVSELIETVNDGVFAMAEECNYLSDGVTFILGAKSELKRLNKVVSANARLVAKLKRAGTDTTDLNALHDAMKKIVSQLTNLLKTKDISEEDIFDTRVPFDNLRQQFDELAQTAQGKTIRSIGGFTLPSEKDVPQLFSEREEDVLALPQGLPFATATTEEAL